MPVANKKIEELQNQIRENIMTVKGTLELLDTSVTEDELHDLLIRAIERTDVIQALSTDLFLFLKKCCDKISEMEKK